MYIKIIRCRRLISTQSTGEHGHFQSYGLTKYIGNTTPFFARLIVQASNGHNSQCLHGSWDTESNKNIFSLPVTAFVKYITSLYSLGIDVKLIARVSWSKQVYFGLPPTLKPSAPVLKHGNVL